MDECVTMETAKLFGSQGRAYGTAAVYIRKQKACV
jgi:hypothetical protein